jgi:hypothetical protein
MNIKEIKPKGLLGFFSAATYEVTAAIEDREHAYSGVLGVAKPSVKPRENISLAADE